MHSGSANVILRNNRNLRKNVNREKFKKVVGNYTIELKEKPYNHIVLNPKALKIIRDKLQKERKQVYRKRIIVFCVVSVILLGLLLF